MLHCIAILSIGTVPVADYTLATQVGSEDRSVYSFCMCPGGQIVPTSVNPNELCLNGMSFSQRQSQWANSALVVSLTPDDMKVYGEKEDDSVLRGIHWQQAMERRAAAMGGGNLVAPVQRATDFMTGTVGDASKSLNPITSSYRMGVKESPCHEIFPNYITDSLREALLDFDRRMPGFLCDDAILHGIETRTSAPVQIIRDVAYQSVSCQGLFPTGEGAGYAGGIVSAAVDGMKVGIAVARQLRGDN